MSDEIREAFENFMSGWQDILAPKRIDIFTNGYIVGELSTTEKIQNLEADCKNLVEVNNNQAKIMGSIEAENKRLKRAYERLSDDYRQKHTLLLELKAENKELLITFDICDKERLQHLREKANIEILKNEKEAENKKLREALEHIREYWNGGNESAVDAAEEAEATANRVLDSGDYDSDGFFDVEHHRKKYHNDKP